MTALNAAFNDDEENDGATIGIKYTKKYKNTRPFISS